MVLMLLAKAMQGLLLDVARDSIGHGLRNGKPLLVALADYPQALAAHRATFVTLQKHGQLRGCIGMLAAVRPLVVDVAENAFAAAFRDPRFPPLAASELLELDVHLSLLTEAEPMVFASEQDLLAQLRPNIDGLILEEGGRRGTFLPSVWGQLPEPKQFLRHLKQKAGLPPDYWSDAIRVYRYQTQLIS